MTRAKKETKKTTEATAPDIVHGVAAPERGEPPAKATPLKRPKAVKADAKKATPLKRPPRSANTKAEKDADVKDTDAKKELPPKGPEAIKDTKAVKPKNEEPRKLKNPSGETYRCLKEQIEVTAVEESLGYDSRGFPRLMGVCANCGVRVFRYIKKGTEENYS